MPYEPEINRLNGMCRGIGNPLVAIYARCYLSRQAHDCDPRAFDYLNNSFNDFLFIIKQLQSNEEKWMGRLGTCVH